jgi:uncharacterized membrane protein YraQ (UPF0718 family)
VAFKPHILLGRVRAGAPPLPILTSFLLQVRALDPMTFAVVAIVLVLTAGLAPFVPALRASIRSSLQE